MDHPATPDASSNPACVINCVWYDGEGQRHDLPLEQLSEKLREGAPGFAWVGLYEPANAVLAQLQEELGLHPLAVEDARNAHQRPKVEAYGDTLFLAVHTAQLTLAGGYAPLLRVVGELERTLPRCRLRSLGWQSSADRRTRCLQLTLTLYIQQVVLKK